MHIDVHVLQLVVKFTDQAIAYWLLGDDKADCVHCTNVDFNTNVHVGPCIVHRLHVL